MAGRNAGRGRDILERHLRGLAGGAQPKNITWVVAGAVTLGTGSDLEGVVLGKTRIVLQTGAVMHGRATLAALAVLEHLFLVVPFRSEALWVWSRKPAISSPVEAP